MVGFSIVMLFMALYYRLPGLMADLAILFYVLLAYALFRYIPVTLTLAGIAGFLLSTGSALDANILIFERLKEELRAGRTLRQAIDLGWQRAWPSIRDSNIATLITCAILFWFGSAFGATIVKGFSLTLALGVVISLFTAIFVTRTFLSLVLTFIQPTNKERWFGI
jgi:preprotein translocase subunit SecD